MKQRGYVWKKVMSANDVITELNRNGWVQIKGSGTSHREYKKNNIKVTVPYHGKEPIGRKTLKSIIDRVNKGENNI